MKQMNNKKGFTLVELLAVVIIMAIIALIATPNIISLLERSKRTDFIGDAKEFASKANYMFKRMEQKGYGSDIFAQSSVTNGTEYKILVKNIEGVSSLDDPYGGKYDAGTSYVLFTPEKHTVTDHVTNTPAEVIKYAMYVYLKGCNENNNKCYELGSGNTGGAVKVSELEISNVLGP